MIRRKERSRRREKEKSRRSKGMKGRGRRMRYGERREEHEVDIVDDREAIERNLDRSKRQHCLLHCIHLFIYINTLRIFNFNETKINF